MLNSDNKEFSETNDNTFSEILSNEKSDLKGSQSYSTSGIDDSSIDTKYNTFISDSITNSRSINQPTINTIKESILSNSFKNDDKSDDNGIESSINTKNVKTMWGMFFTNALL